MEEIKEELNNYQKNKASIYKWRNKNIDAYHQKMQQYNKTCYEKNRDNILTKVKAYQQRKQDESGVPKRRVGRPCKVYE